jgi:hypothetical protein
MRRSDLERKMKLRDLVTVINAMRGDGVIERYAIGGAVGATFYIETVATLDIDVLVSFKATPGQLTIGRGPSSTF